MSSKKVHLKRTAEPLKTNTGKQQKIDQEEGWLVNVVAEQRNEARDIKFNQKRLRYLSETKTVKQGSEGVLYWMGRDQRVQGNFTLVTSSWNAHTMTFLLMALKIFCCPPPFLSLPCVDNWALIYAQHLATKEELPLHICFCLMPKFLEATFRHYSFMLKGLQEVAKVCLIFHSIHLLGLIYQTTVETSLSAGIILWQRLRVIYEAICVRNNQC